MFTIPRRVYEFGQIRKLRPQKTVRSGALAYFLTVNFHGIKSANVGNGFPPRSLNMNATIHFILRFALGFCEMFPVLRFSLMENKRFLNVSGGCEFFPQNRMKFRVR